MSEQSGHLRWLWAAGIGAAIICVLGFRWINFTLNRELFGFAFSVFGDSPNHAWFVLGSFGVAALLILVCAMAASIADAPGLRGVLGSILLIVMFWAYLQLAVGNSSLLLSLARQSDWWLIIAGHPPHVARVEPGVWPQLGFDTVMDRLLSGWYYLGLGWYLGVVAAIVLIGSAITSHRVRRWPLLVTATAFMLAALGGVFVLRPILAERTFVAALGSEARGEFATAKRQYRRAMELDSWYLLNPQLHERIGRLDAAVGRNDSLEARLYRAELIFDHDQGPGSIWQLEVAIHECDRIAESERAIANAAKMRANEMRAFYGLHLFQAGSFGAAVTVWEDLLSREPDNWLAAYYLTLGYPTTSDYRGLAKVSKRFLRECGDPLTTGVFYDSLGKAQMHFGDFDGSHASYYSSYKLDYMNNNAAIRSLVGP